MNAIDLWNISMVNERYLVLNRHGTSIFETFFTEAVAWILDFRCVPGHIFFLKTHHTKHISKS